MGRTVLLPLNLFVMDRMDYYEILPSGFREYLSNYGWHFSKPMCEWAVSKMRDRNDKPVKMKTKEQVQNSLESNGIILENDKGYDKVFVYHMGMSDYLGSSVIDESRLAHYVKDVLDDRDGYDGIAFTRFMADCSAKGVPIIWEDMI